MGSLAEHLTTHKRKENYKEITACKIYLKGKTSRSKKITQESVLRNRIMLMRLRDGKMMRLRLQSSKFKNSTI
jgi:hypothetical protein